MFATLTMSAPTAATPAAFPTVLARSADDLRHAVRLSRHQTVHLDGRGLDRVLRLDAQSRRIEAQAATRWTALAEALGREEHRAEALACGEASPWPTLGEAIAAAAPGPDGAPLGRHVLSFTIVLPDGELKRVDRETSRGLFDLVLGGQGCVGVLYSATLSVHSLLAAAAAPAAPEELAFAPMPGCPERIELLLPPDRTEPFLADLRRQAEDRRICLAGVTARRYVPGESGLLDWARREWAALEVRYVLRPTLGAAVTRAEFRRGLVASAVGLGGSFWLADAADASAEALLACYPRLPAFLAEARRADPAERLQTRWSRELREKLRARGS